MVEMMRTLTYNVDQLPEETDASIELSFRKRKRKIQNINKINLGQNQTSKRSGGKRA